MFIHLHPQSTVHTVQQELKEEVKSKLNLQVCALDMHLEASNSPIAMKREGGREGGKQSQGKEGGRKRRSERIVYGIM